MSGCEAPRYWRLHLTRPLMGQRLYRKVITNNPGIHYKEVIETRSYAPPSGDLTYYELKEDGSFVRPNFESQNQENPPQKSESSQ